MSRQLRRAAPAVRAGALLASIAALLGSAAGPPSDTWRALAAAIRSSEATPDLDQLLSNSAAFAAWVCLGWLAITVVLEVASTLPGAAGRGCAAVATRVTPVLVRRIVHGVIGVSVLAGPLAAGSAFATGPSTTTSTSSPVDRPISVAAPGPITATTAPLTLDRPATAFVASPPPTATRSSAGPAALVTGIAHRDAGNPGDRNADSYVVHRGDTLWDIAARHLGPGATAVDISRAWPAWYDANRAVIGPDPSLIQPGELLSPPAVLNAPVSTR